MWHADEKGKGVTPERQEIYIENPTRNDGSIIDEKSAKMIAQFSNEFVQKMHKVKVENGESSKERSDVNTIGGNN